MLVAFGDLGAELADITLDSLHPTDQPLAWSDERRQAAILGIRSSQLIPAPCKELLIHDSIERFTFVLRGSVGTGPGKYSDTSSESSQLLNTYQSLANAQVQAACGGGTLISNDCVLSRGKAQYRKFQDALASQTPAQIVSSGQRDPSSPLAGITSDEATVLQAYTEVLRIPNSAHFEGDLARTLAAYKGMSVDQKLLIAQMITAMGNRPGYDTNRSNGVGPTASGVVTNGQIVSAQQNNILVGGNSGAQIKELIRQAGVCRDIHSLAALVVSDLGLPNAYVLSFTLSNGEGHATMIVGDPDHPLVNHQVDWGVRRDTAGGSPATLFQNGTDIAESYGLYLAGGRNVANIQSEEGKFLASGTGFRLKDSLARDTGNLVAAEVALGATGDTRARMLIGQDGMGATYIGAAAIQNWDREGHFPGQAGIMIFSQQRPTQNFTASGKTYELDGIYAQVEQKYRSGELKITPALRARFEATLTLMGMVSRARGGDSKTRIDGFDAPDGALAGQLNEYGEAAVIVNQGLPGAATRVTYRAGLKISMGGADVRNDDLGRMPVPVLDELLVSAELRQRLTSTPQGKVFLVAAAKAVLDELGVRGRAELGVQTDQIAFTMGTEGRLTDATPTYKDGTVRKIYGTFAWAPVREATVGITAEVPIEKNAPHPAGGDANLTLRF